MFRLQITLGVILMILALATVAWIWVTEEARLRRTAASQLAFQIQDGAELFVRNCAPCHGEQAQGVRGLCPPLNSVTLLEQRVEETGWTGSLHDYVEHTIRAGRLVSTRPEEFVGNKPLGGMAMPFWSQEFGGPLRDDQIESITVFLLNYTDEGEEALAEATAPAEGTAVAEGEAEGEATAPAEGEAEGEATAPAEGEAQGEATAPAEGEPQGEGETEGGDLIALGRELYEAQGCVGCHALADAGGAGAVGPTHEGLAQTAAERIESPDYTGAADSPEAYIHESLVDPGVYVVPDYPPAMPSYSELSEDQLNALVEYLMTVTQ
ncbi:MAG TPA: c-type cytochrome [Ardenticatenaceae bacterium]|nr:c-type cytochrome [Ardenticatenaceae bacterium]